MPFPRPIDEGRVMRGQAICRLEGQIKRVDEKAYQLKSQSRHGLYTVVRGYRDYWRCSCPDHIYFQETTPIPVKLAVLNVADSKNAMGHLEVVRELENQGDAPSSYTKIVGTFYDDAGKVIYVGFTFTSPDTIPPATRYSFKLIVLSEERSSKIARYSLVTESQEYTSVPESPWPILLAALTLTLATVALKRKRHR